MHRAQQSTIRIKSDYIKIIPMIASPRKLIETARPETMQRTDSQQGVMRRTYFRLREIKQNGTPAKMLAVSSPKRHADFYSHQQAAIQYSKAKDKKMSSTASNFYNNISRIGKMSSIQQRETSPKSQMRKTFFNQRSNPEKNDEKPMSGSLLFGRTSLNFHKQDIFKNQKDNNYLNKYNILKELGKGSFSTVFLAKKQSNNARNQRSASPQDECQSPVGKEAVKGINVSIDSPQLSKNECLNDRSTCEGQKMDYGGLPRLSQPEGPKLEVQLQRQQDLYAIKVYEKFKMNKDPHKFKNIRKEINIMQNLDNEGVVKLYESVQTLTKISLVVEYGGQESLLDYVKHNYPLPMETIRDISLQLIKAIAYIHDKNIVHRDIKLQNVLINNGQIKLIDFGFSCLTHKQQKLTVICGTPNYMAPEVISRKEYIGEQADIWSFGVVVYALGEGRHPFKAETYSELERLVNRGKIEFKKIKDNKFIDFVKKILKPKGSERPTARQIMDVRWLKGECQ